MAAEAEAAVLVAAEVVVSTVVAEVSVGVADIAAGECALADTRGAACPAAHEGATKGVALVAAVVGTLEAETSVEGVEAENSGEATSAVVAAEGNSAAPVGGASSVPGVVDESLEVEDLEEAKGLVRIQTGKLALFLVGKGAGYRLIHQHRLLIPSEAAMRFRGWGQGVENKVARFVMDKGSARVKAHCLEDQGNRDNHQRTVLIHQRTGPIVRRVGRMDDLQVGKMVTHRVGKTVIHMVHHLHRHIIKGGTTGTHQHGGMAVGTICGGTIPSQWEWGRRSGG